MSSSTLTMTTIPIHRVEDMAGTFPDWRWYGLTGLYANDTLRPALPAVGNYRVTHVSLHQLYGSGYPRFTAREARGHRGKPVEYRHCAATVTRVG